MLKKGVILFFALLLAGSSVACGGAHQCTTNPTDEAVTPEVENTKDATTNTKTLQKANPNMERAEMDE